MAETPNNQLIPRNYGDKDCRYPIVGGLPSNRYDFVLKPDNADNTFPDVDLDLEPQCLPWYYFNMKVGSLWVLNNITVSENVLAVGQVVSNSGAHVLSNKKNLPFDMPHPNKKGWRLRHVCIEGPEIAVYCRGRVQKDGIISLPSFWQGLVDINDMSINLTPIGHWQELYIKEVIDNKVIVKNNNFNVINADYHIIARRLDDDLIVEYEGENYTDYPNGNEGYAFNYEHTYVENLIKQEIKKNLINNV
jgi:hypothetical protein